MANENTFAAGNVVNHYWSSQDGAGYYWVGDRSDNSRNGAVRFPGVTGSGNCNEAQMYLHVDDASSNSGAMDLDVYGIDEDNTADFSSDPMGRSSTSAKVDWFLDRPAENVFVNINVTSIVNEVRSRGGWSSGNALALKTYESGNTGTDIWFSGGAGDVPPSTTSSLVIREAADPDRTFDTQTKSVGSSVALEDYGIKISAEGHSALTSDPKKKTALISSSRFLLKIKMQGSIAGTNIDISHLLPYAPSFLAFVDDNAGRKYKVPSVLWFGKSDEYAGASSNESVLNLYVNNYLQGGGDAREFYYYVFVESL